MNRHRIIATFAALTLLAPLTAWSQQAPATDSKNAAPDRPSNAAPAPKAPAKQAPKAETKPAKPAAKPAAATKPAPAAAPAPAAKPAPTATPAPAAKPAASPATPAPAAPKPTAKPDAAPVPAAKPADAPAKDPLAIQHKPIKDMKPADATEKTPKKDAAADGKKKVERTKSGRIKRPPPHKRRFIEGELANVGASGLVPWQNRFGIVVGPQRLGQVFYVEVRPAINYTTELAERDFTMSFALPVRLELLDTRPDRGWTTEAGRSRIGTIRAQDWDEWQDYARIVQYINYGGKEQHFYLDVNGFKATSIGHGTVLKRYNPNLNVNRRRVSAELDAFFDYGGFEAFANDITGPNIVSGLAFIKPLSLINRKNYFLRSFSIGAHFTADRSAPMRNNLDFEDADKDGRYETEPLIDQNTFNPSSIDSQVVAYGTSVEAKLVDTPSVDWKTYVDVSFLETGLPTDQDFMFWNKEDIGLKAMKSQGMSWGHLLRLNLGQKTVHALRIRLELRQYDNNYLPSYFDSLYSVQKYQYTNPDAAACSVASKGQYALANNTKQQCVLGRDPNAEKVLGAYFEASWKVSHYWAMAMALEVNNRKDPVTGTGSDNNFFIHFEMPHVGSFQWLATYHRRSRASVADLFAFGGEEGLIGNNDMFIIKGRYRLSDTIFFNGEVLTPFFTSPESVRRNAFEINVNAEFGFGYGSNNDDD